MPDLSGTMAYWDAVQWIAIVVIVVGGGIYAWLKEKFGRSE